MLQRIPCNGPHVFPPLSSCLVKITGDLTMSFPAGITRIFTANPNVPVLSFRLINISRIDHFLPNQKLLYRFLITPVCLLFLLFHTLPCSTSRLCVSTVTRLRATRTPETSGSTCRRCSFTCRGRLNSTLRPPTTMSACSSIR